MMKPSAAYCMLLFLFHFIQPTHVEAQDASQGTLYLATINYDTATGDRIGALDCGTLQFLILRDSTVVQIIDDMGVSQYTRGKITFQRGACVKTKSGSYRSTVDMSLLAFNGNTITGNMGPGNVQERKWNYKTEKAKPVSYRIQPFTFKNGARGFVIYNEKKTYYLYPETIEKMNETIFYLQSEGIGEKLKVKIKPFKNV